jgi:hypothetical protein
LRAAKQRANTSSSHASAVQVSMGAMIIERRRSDY